MHFSTSQSAALAIFVLSLPAWGSPIPSSTASDVQDGYFEYNPRSVKAADFWKRMPVFDEDDDIVRRAPVFDDDDGIQMRDLEARGWFSWLDDIPKLFETVSKTADTVNQVADSATNVAQAGSAVASTVSNIKNAAHGQPQQPQQK